MIYILNNKILYLIYSNNVLCYVDSDMKSVLREYGLSYSLQLHHKEASIYIPGCRLLAESVSNATLGILRVDGD